MPTEPADGGDAVRRLAESTGVPVSDLPQDNPQAAVRQLESELHRRLARWIKLEDELRRQNAEAERLAAALDISRSAVITLEATVLRLTAEGDEARRQIETLQGQIAAERRAANSTTESHVALEREAQELRRSLEERSRQLAQDSARLNDATRELESHKDALLGLQATHHDQKAIAEKHEQEKAALASAIADLEAALAKSRSQHRGDSDAREALKLQVQKAEAAIASQRLAAEAERSRLDRAYQEQRQKSEALTAEVNRWEVTALRADDARQGLSELVASLEKNVGAREVRVGQLEALLADRAVALSTADSEIKALKTQEGQLLLRLNEHESELERRIGQVDSLEQLGGALSLERDQQRATIEALNTEIRRQKKLVDVLGHGVPNIDDIAATVTTLDAWVHSQINTDARPNGATAPACRVIEELHGSQSTKHLLDKHVFTIGRSADCDLRVGGPYTSRQHARILNEESKAVIEDLGSANGIAVNHEQVARCVLHDGDIVEIGGTRFRFVDHSQGHERTLHG